MGDWTPSTVSWRSVAWPMQTAARLAAVEATRTTARRGCTSDTSRRRRARSAVARSTSKGAGSRRPGSGSSSWSNRNRRPTRQTGSGQAGRGAPSKDAPLATFGLGRSHPVHRQSVREVRARPTRTELRVAVPELVVARYARSRNGALRDDGAGSRSPSNAV